MGVVWLVMGATWAMTHVGRWSPKSIVRGIQLSLDMMPAIQRGKTVSSWRLLGV